jgi:hypothetical protein
MAQVVGIKESFECILYIYLIYTRTSRARCPAGGWESSLECIVIGEFWNVFSGTIARLKALVRDSKLM